MKKFYKIIYIKYNTKTKEELQVLVNDLSISLGDIDTSAIADIGTLFKYTKKTLVV